MRLWALTVLAALALARPAAADPATDPAATPAMDEQALGEQRGGLSTPLGVDIGFGAAVRTYVDGRLALETRMTLTPEGLRAVRVFDGADAGGLPRDLDAALTSAPVSVAPGLNVIHDLTANRIASLVMNAGDDRVIRQDTDLTVNLPQLPELQQRIGLERLTQALQALSPDATGLAR
jgi:hypothetical protein